MTTDYVVPGLTARVEHRRRREADARARHRYRRAVRCRLAAAAVVCVVTLVPALGAQLAVWLVG